MRPLLFLSLLVVLPACDACKSGSSPPPTESAAPSASAPEVEAPSPTNTVVAIPEAEDQIHCAPDDANVTTCSIIYLTERVRREIGNMPGHEDFWLSFRTGPHQGTWTEVAKMPWATRVDVSAFPAGDVSALFTLPRLKAVRLSGAKLAHLAPFAKYPDLEELMVNADKVLEDTSLDGIKGLTKLRALTIYDDTSIKDISAVAGMKDLEILNVSFTSIDSIAAIKDLTKLHEVDFAFTKVTDVAPLEHLAGTLTVLDVSETKLESFAFLDAFTKMKTLSLSTTKIENVSFAAKMPELRILNASNCPGLKDIGPLAGNKKLERVVVNRSPIASIAPVAGLPLLKLIGVADTNVSDVMPLAKSPSHELQLFAGVNVPPKNLEALKKARPDINITEPRHKPP